MKTYTIIMRTDHETLMLDRILDPVSEALTPESARRLVALRADALAQRRMDELAEKCIEGLLTPDERTEYEAYVSAANLLAVLQAKARRLLSNH